MPITCIYSKTDGVVPWQYCCEAETIRADIQNIEVFGSHSGSVSYTAVLLSVATMLHQRLEDKAGIGIPTHYEKVLFPEYWRQQTKKIANSVFSKLPFGMSWKQ